MRKEIVFGIGMAVSAWALAAGVALAATPAELGRAHFTNPAFAGGSKACNDCHANGRGLEKAGSKTRFTIMGGQQGSLADVVNMCIVNALHGKAIPNDSQEMREMVAYIKSLGEPAAAAAE